MSNDDKNIYIVKRPITFMGSVFAAGSEINLTDADAHNIGMGNYLDKKQTEQPTPPQEANNEGGEAGESSEGSGSQTDKPAGEGSDQDLSAAGSEAGQDNSQA